MLMPRGLISTSKDSCLTIKDDVMHIARCHMACMPWTSTSLAGVDTVYHLYSILLDDPCAMVIWRKGDCPPGNCSGAFASGTLDLEHTRYNIKSHLRMSDKILLSYHNLLQPCHLLSGMIWKRIIPRVHIGYILTIGVVKEMKTEKDPISGSYLLGILENWFKSNGAIESWSDTEQKNERALEFYTKSGYEIVHSLLGQVLLRKHL